MACVVNGEKRGRPGKWIVDYRDGAGVRRWITFETKREADDTCAAKRLESRQRIRPDVNPNITVTEYAKRWTRVIASHVKPRTLESYELHLDRHILPALGQQQVRRIHKGQLRDFLAAKKAGGPASRSARNIYATLRAMLSAAVEDGVIIFNPAAGLGKRLRLTTSARDRDQDIKAMDADQLGRFLEAAQQHEPRRYPLFYLLAHTGLRLGEAFGVQWSDLEYDGERILVERTISPGGQVGTPKSGRSRRVDMSGGLQALLRRLYISRKVETLKRGWPEVPPWVFCNEAGKALDPRRVEKAFKRILGKATLPLHFSPHSLRHSFASLLIQDGVSIAYVQRQLGHASISLTVDTYGRWLPTDNKAAVDRLDARIKGQRGGRGSKVVAKQGVSRETWRAQRELNPRPTDSKSGALSS